MSLYEVSYKIPFVIKTLWANKIIKRLSIPSDINLESQTTRFYEIHSKVMAQDKPMNDNKQGISEIFGLMGICSRITFNIKN